MWNYRVEMPSSLFRKFAPALTAPSIKFLPVAMESVSVGEILAKCVEIMR